MKRNRHTEEQVITILKAHEREFEADMVFPCRSACGCRASGASA